jgi:ABC-type dipeptide/oligopeptide/nickel transport system ATPase component
MEFVIDSGKVNCLRLQCDARSGRRQKKLVCSFHENVSRVAPHVAAVLSADEVQQLQQWLDERAQLQAKLQQEPMEKTLLVTLPMLFQQASDALDQVEALDGELYDAIELHLRQLQEKFQRVQARARADAISIDKMQTTDVLKQHLDAIKSGL